MRIYLIIFTFLISIGVNAKTLEYGFINEKWICKENVATGKNTSANFYRECNQNNLWDIHNRDDQKWIKDGIFHVNTYNEYKPSINKNNNCGMKYNPKDGKTYKYPECVKTFNY